MPDTANERKPPRVATTALGVILLGAGVIAALWRAASLASLATVAQNPPTTLVAQYFIANGFDFLWCGLMAVGGFSILKRSMKATYWLAGSTVAWIPGTALYAYQVSDGDFMAQSLGTSTGGLVAAVLMLRGILLLPNLAAIALNLRRGATVDTSNGPA